MQPVAIFGAGGLGRMVRDILLQSAAVRPAVFLDSDQDKHGLEIDGLPVVGGLERLSEVLERGLAGVVVAIGDNDVRIELAEEIRARGLRLISAIHPSAICSPTVACGEHVIMGPRAALCVHAVIGAHVIIGAGAIVEHDNHIGAGASLAPAVRLAGGVRVGERATLEVGACAAPGVSIGARAIVRAGAIVIRDVAEGDIVGGAPGITEPGARSRFVPHGSAQHVGV